MNDRPARGALDSAQAQRIADHVRRGMLAGDRASHSLGMRVVAMTPGTATLAMTVRADMLNGFDICHGGFITTLADSAFAFACNSGNEFTVAAGLTVDFLAAAREGDVLTARAEQVSHAGRTGVYDIVVTNQHGQRVALVRGRASRVKGRPSVPGEAA
jgi:acyl-CoA thioesterase